MFSQDRDKENRLCTATQHPAFLSNDSAMTSIFVDKFHNWLGPLFSTWFIVYTKLDKPAFDICHIEEVYTRLACSRSEFVEKLP